MCEIQKLEFKNLLPGQGDPVRALVLRSADVTRENGFTPQGRAAFERYAASEAMERRGALGYRHELVYVCGALAGMIELKGPSRVSMLYIRPDYANKGLGSRLIARAAAHCAETAPKAKYLTVYATDNAVNFYERVGFVRSGSRKENGGIFSTPCRLPLKAKGKIASAKLHGSQVDFFVFTGTGNSLLTAQAAAETLRREGLSVRLASMDEPCPQNLSEESSIGLAFPIGCFSTYPTVWRFVQSMPEGEGREVFMLATYGGAAAGMQGPLRKVLTKKGYKPLAAKILVMPRNYGNKVLPVEKNAERVEKSLVEARSFAYDLLKGGTAWNGGIPLLSAFFYRLGQTRRPWNFFYKIFPILADREKCVRCKRCKDNCPEKAIFMDADNYPVVTPSICESCQRCVGFCPTGALRVPGKPAEPYRAMDYEEFKGAFR
ncbi:MAG: EFR1 family ferrodoxin [Synergistaceae bacterium]|jgi:GNAT superfamily N-acetyltransferase/Pyruvate/2-oxoacid:ferredoxin oxidoreductase delta subunit|nr:EFR1 family ferrodoxin [Synergistaceae bacterium]